MGEMNHPFLVILTDSAIAPKFSSLIQRDMQHSMVAGQLLVSLAIFFYFMKAVVIADKKFVVSMELAMNLYKAAAYEKIINHANIAKILKNNSNSNSPDILMEPQICR